MKDSWFNTIKQSKFCIHHNDDASNINNSLDPEIEAIFPSTEGIRARTEIQSWEKYSPTPLHSIDSLANELGVSKIALKDESSRFGLGSFKALGGAYAVYCVLSNLIGESTGKTNVTSSELRSGIYKGLTRDEIVVTATDGNHGKSVAWGAQEFGCSCKIYINAEVSKGREKAIAAYGCEMVRIDGDYDESVRQADRDAKKNGWHLVADTSYMGYRQIPALVMQGYTMIASEIGNQLKDEIPTHVFLPGGVGGVAAAVSAEMWRIWKNNCPYITIVEPKAADCLFQSCIAKTPTNSSGDLKTVMACLSAGEVSLLAWEILSKSANSFMVLSDCIIAPTMWRLAQENIVSGESGAASLAGLSAIAFDAKARKTMGIDKNSRILILSTEGATDPQIYQQLVGMDPSKLSTNHSV
ncbi:MAG: diaminopropionate ammonia-lyase [Rhodospirillaceae bacterium]|nr:diaminopropionate ammonia-lyase [Rhodospirillaceae bacterium]|tara:strand:+ start:1213 stop:2448 length:1236 start_codon:yes stop_codon:yes gene_type:complete